MKCVSADVVDLLMLSLWPNNLHFNFSYTPKEATAGLNASLCGLSALYHGYIECIHSPKKTRRMKPGHSMKISHSCIMC